MNKEKLYDVIRSPKISEKSTMLQDKHSQYTFEISSWATKSNIKSALFMIYGLKPKSISILNVKGKSKRRGNILGKRKTIKKAYVTFQPDAEVNLTKIN